MIDAQRIRTSAKKPLEGRAGRERLNLQAHRMAQLESGARVHAAVAPS